MTRDQIIKTRQTLVSRLPVTGEILRGSLLERTVRHARGCATCARGEGHPLSVLTVSYPGRRTRQFSLRREQVGEVRRWLGNYHRLREALEAASLGTFDSLREHGREALLEVLTDFLKANNLKVDWEGVESAPNEALVNALAMMSPYGPPEKQAMLEAPDLKTRAEILIAVTEMDLAKKRTSGDTGLQ